MQENLKLKRENLRMERTIEDITDENLQFRSRPGPTVYIGGIIIPFHKKAMERDKAKNGVWNQYYWPETWFPNLKEKIVKGPGNTE